MLDEAQVGSKIVGRNINNLRYTDDTILMAESKEIPEKAFTSASLTILKPLTVCVTTNCGKFFKRQEYQTTLPVS